MRPTSRHLFPGIAMVLLAGSVVRAQNEGELHEFTDKRGHKVSARLVGISEDRRMMSILREDGKSFETPINQLSLDDQQYVKDWLNSRLVPGSVASATSPRVDLDVTRSSGKTSRHRNDNYEMEGKESTYRITLKNLSRDVISSARVEYALVLADAVSLREDEDTAEWNHRSHTRDGVSPRVKILGHALVENLPFNEKINFETPPVNVDRVSLHGNELYLEDELLGLKVRVVSAGGAVIHDTHSGSAEVGSMTWEEIAALDDPPVIE